MCILEALEVPIWPWLVNLASIYQVFETKCTYFGDLSLPVELFELASGPVNSGLGRDDQRTLTCNEIQHSTLPMGLWMWLRMNDWQALIYPLEAMDLPFRFTSHHPLGTSVPSKNNTPTAPWPSTNLPSRFTSHHRIWKSVGYKVHIHVR
ncbi:hypothetical protein B0H19DRAFT_1082529 [Mycena capillaripes]|nr:hypothetical protein B0H19DRAFT_1082529 [Mycena capillaripes]